MDKRRLGRTNLMVSQVGFGGTWIAELPEQQAVEVVRRAFDLGINYFDTARWDGDSEEKLGAALDGIRDQCVIATKTGSRTKKESMADFTVSLKNLCTDHVDILQLHGIDDEKTLAKALSEDGSLQTCIEARWEGLTDFVGITGHKPRVLAKALKTNEFDMVLVPINVVTPQALEELLPIAEAYDVGVVAMKPFMAKTSNLITCLYQPSLSLISDEPELKAFLGGTSEEQASSLLHFCLSKDISTVIAGVKSVAEVDAAAKAANTYTGLSAETQRRFNPDLGNYCRDCGQCMPCKENVNIPAVLRFQMFAETYGLKNWAAKLYGGLEIKADQCRGCGECEPKCPHKLPIQSKLEEAHRSLS